MSFLIYRLRPFYENQLIFWYEKQKPGQGEPVTCRYDHFYFHAVFFKKEQGGNADR